MKVLDFGLAKLAGPPAPFADATAAREGGHYVDTRGVRLQPDMSLSPTITSPALMTNAGMLRGTAAYMSPEQAEGRPADKRSDLWAFGCVLFEMLTGKRAFEAEDVSETLAAVLRGEPEWAALPANTPPAIRTLLRRCLERDRRRRVADSAAVLFVLDEHTNLLADAPLPDRAAFANERNASVRAVEHRARKRLLTGAAVGILLTTFAAVATWWLMRPAPPPITRLGLAPLATAAGIAENSPDIAVTPDGSRVVYFTDPAAGIERPTLAVRELARTEPITLTATAACE